MIFHCPFYKSLSRTFVFSPGQLYQRNGYVFNGIVLVYFPEYRRVHSRRQIPKKNNKSPGIKKGNGFFKKFSFQSILNNPAFPALALPLLYTL